MGMAHARRFFIQARDNDNKRSDHVVSELQLLYRLEEEGREDKAEAEEIYTRRQAIAMSTGGLARWIRLMAYAPDGVLLIDNNRIENHIRPVSVGRNKEQP
jgi:transposase